MNSVNSVNAIGDGNHIRIYNAFMIRESIKEIDGRFYDPDDRAWVVPYTRENTALLALMGVALGEDLQESVVDEAKANETPIIPMPIKAIPYQHQIRAYNFALRLFGIGGTA